jgi:hypothetical protein
MSTVKDMASNLKLGSSNACNRLILSESCEVNELLLNISSGGKCRFYIVSLPGIVNLAY